MVCEGRVLGHYSLTPAA